jgi:hypothetical protein
MRFVAGSRVVAAFVVLTVAVALARSADAAIAQPTTARQLASIVAASGMGCINFVPTTDAATSSGLPNGDTGRCTIGGHRSALTVYATEADRAVVTDAIPTESCPAASASGRKTVRLVFGSTWTISTRSRVTSRQLVEALSGLEPSRRTYHCP